MHSRTVDQPRPIADAPSSLDEIYPSHGLLFARSFPGAETWVSPSPAFADSQTANNLAVIGDLPAIVHRGAVNASLRRLMDLSECALPADLRTYGSVDEALAMLGAAAADGLVPIAQHVPPPEAAFAMAGYVSPDLLSRLNDKARLAQIVPAPFLPDRRLVPCSALDADAPPTLPVVVKASTAQSTGGGNAIRICRDHDDWARAVAYFQARTHALDAIVIEEFVAFEQTWCVNFAIDPDGARWRPLGAAVQIVSAAGQYLGSLCGPGLAPPGAADALTAHIAGTAARRGYRGIAAFDCGVDRDGRLLAFDLNFRLNGSTPLLLLHARACARAGASITRLLRLTCRRPAAEIEAAVAPLIREGGAMIVGLFDGAMHAERLGWCRVGLVLAGTSVGEIERRARDLARRLDAVARPEQL